MHHFISTIYSKVTAGIKSLPAAPTNTSHLFSEGMQHSTDNPQLRLHLPLGVSKETFEKHFIFPALGMIRFHKSPSPSVPVSLIPLNALLSSTAPALLLLSPVSCPGATCSAHRLRVFQVCLSGSIAFPPLLHPSTKVRKHNPTGSLRAVRSSTWHRERG